MKKTLSVLVGAIGIAGAIGLSLSTVRKDNEPLYVEGVVIKEFGTIIDRQEIIERSEGASFGNKSVRFGDLTYGIQFRRTDDGKAYTFAVNPLQEKLEALNAAIENGTRIRMRRNAFNCYLKGTVGKINDSDLEVLGQE